MGNYYQKIYVTLVFLLNVNTIVAQQWAMDEVAEDTESSSFGGIVGVILVFGLIMLLGFIFGGKNKNNESKVTSGKDEFENMTDFLPKPPQNKSNKSDNNTPLKEVSQVSSEKPNLIIGDDIENFHIPDGIKIICKKSFREAKNIKNLYISDSVEEIEDFAFSGLKIESVHIPASIKKWGESVFFMCTQLKSVSLEDGIQNLSFQMFMDCEGLTSLELPDSIKCLPDGIFLNCKSLRHIKLPSQINSIGEGAFQYCESLETIELPETLNGLHDNTFSFCYKLYRVIIPEGITVISSRCFEYCYALKNIRIPSTIQHIDTDAFYGCDGIILEVPKGQSSQYSEMKLEGISKIIEYETKTQNNSDEIKRKSEGFLRLQDYKRKQKDYEFRKEMGLLTKEEFEIENGFYDDIDDRFYDDDDDIL